MLAQAQFKPVPEENYTATLRDLVHQCLSKDPDKRPTAHELLRHPLIADALRKLYAQVPPAGCHTSGPSPPNVGGVHLLRCKPGSRRESAYLLHVMS